MPTRRSLTEEAPRSVDTFATWLVEALAPLGEPRIRKMFGGAGLYVDDLIIGVVDEGRLYFKVDDTTRPQFEAARMKPFEYAPGHVMKGYWRVPPAVLEDEESLRVWARRAREVSAKAGERAARPKAPRAAKKIGVCAPAAPGLRSPSAFRPPHESR
jgi:DNA transformation protein